MSEAQTKLAEFNKKPQDDKINEAEKAELEARVEMLKDLNKNYEDPGILLDCVVYFDGKDWRAVIDVNESGDLRGLLLFRIIKRVIVAQTGNNGR